MIVRTYGRRSRGGIGSTLSDSTLNGDVSDDPFSFSEEEEEESPQDYNFTYPSSQDSARWTFDSEPYPMSQDTGPDPAGRKPLLEPVGGSKKAKNEKGETRFYRPPPPVMPPPPPPLTATLMETQEFGEMMEYVDEVNFALDGLKSRQPVRIRRASLLSLLTVCETSQQRMLLRAHGMEKTIVNAIMGLSLDDPPSNLAVSALFYVLTADSHLLAMRRSLTEIKSSLSFTKLVINFIKILSDLCLLRRNSLTTSAAEMPLHCPIESEQSFEFFSVEENKADSSRDSLMRSSQECSSSGRVFPGLGLNKSQRKQWLSSQSESQEPETSYMEDKCMIKMRIRSSMSSSSSMNSKSTGCGAMINGAHLKMKSSLGKRPCDNLDPF